MGKLTNLLVLIGIPDINEIKNAKRVGNKIFNYGNPQVGPEEPATFRRNYGIALWQAGFDGAMPYAYQHSMGSIWNDFDHKLYRDHNFTYPTVNGVIDTIAWEGFREAVDDVRYISTLESLAVRLSSSNQPNIVKNAKNALRFLRKLKYRKHFDPSRVRGELSGLILNLLNYSSKNSGAISKESKER